MDVAANAAKAGRVARSFLSEFLREAYPWLPDDRLGALLDTTAASIEQELVKQEPTMVAARSRSSFFSLSAELRNRIYELVLGEDRRILIEERPGEYGGYYPGEFASVGSDAGTLAREPVRLRPGSLKLLTLCKQVRAEVLPMFWDKMKIKVNYYPERAGGIIGLLDSGPARDWLRLIGKKNAAHIRSFNLLATTSKAEIMAQELADLEKLKPFRLPSLGLRGSALSIEYFNLRGY